jgi:hypothetical protein
MGLELTLKHDSPHQQHMQHMQLPRGFYRQLINATWPWDLNIVHIRLKRIT